MTEETNTEESTEKESSQTENENQEQSSDIIYENKEESTEETKAGLSKQAITFLILFLLSTGLLIYYQFYDTGGKWKFTLKHRPAMIAADTTKKASTDTTHLAQKDTAKNADSLSGATTPATTTQRTASKSTSPPPGTYYMVQIGTFEGYDLSKFNGQYNSMLHEEKDGNLTKLTLGQFEKQEDAKTFVAEMKKLGVKGAWVLKISDGVRQKGLK